MRLFAWDGDGRVRTGIEGGGTWWNMGLLSLYRVYEVFISVSLWDIHLERVIGG